MAFRSRWWGGRGSAAGVMNAFEIVYAPDKAAARQAIEEQSRRKVPIPAPGDGSLFVELDPDPSSRPGDSSRRFAARVVLRRPPSANSPGID